MAKKRTHIHQYRRIYPNSFGVGPINKLRGVWGCALPDCTHYMPHNVANQVEGKGSLCNSCMEPFVLDDDNMKEDRPRCYDCRNPDPDRIVLDADFDFERAEAKSFVATTQNKPLEEVTEAEIDRMIQLRRLNMK